MALFLSVKIGEECISEVLSSFQADLSSQSTNFGMPARQFTERVTARIVPCLIASVSKDTWRRQLPSCFPLPPSASVSAVKNRRRKMEDRHVVLPSVSLIFPNNKVFNIRNSHLVLRRPYDRGTMWPVSHVLKEIHRGKTHALAYNREAVKFLRFYDLELSLFFKTFFSRGPR